MYCQSRVGFNPFSLRACTQPIDLLGTNFPIAIYEPCSAGIRHISGFFYVRDKIDYARVPIQIREVMGRVKESTLVLYVSMNPLRWKLI